ncbi:transposase [Celeribacter indicus]|uniref:Transposase n=1 Tax=Celeribacter indicus TaxID=1208324 RepID=A0A0B5DVQ1_9RHOB|nr:transposase [Celeribacter indicus]
MQTPMAGLTADALIALWGIKGETAFAACGREGPVPEIAPGTGVALDDLTTHRNTGAARALREHGCRFLYLPPCSPEPDPIELAVSRLKAHLRRTGAVIFTTRRRAGTTSRLPNGVMAKRSRRLSGRSAAEHARRRPWHQTRAGLSGWRRRAHARGATRGFGSKAPGQSLRGARTGGAGDRCGEVTATISPRASAAAPRARSPAFPPARGRRSRTAHPAGPRDRSCRAWGPRSSRSSGPPAR